MIAFDADVLTEILAGHPALSQRAAQISVHEQTVPIVVIEEILRGRLNSVRQAEAAKSKISLERAYELLEETLDALRQVTVLPYSSQAESLFQDWRSRKIRVGTHDLRIAAICIVHSAKLITRNRRDFEQVPGLSLELWT
jgi:tRNA(fMet)-specific endonuclease VapC